MKITTLLIFAGLILSFGLRAHALDELGALENLDQEEFSPYAWTPGLHIFGGLGINSSMYRSGDQRRTLGLGSNLRADVDYFLTNRWAVEFSSSVKFNRVDHNLVWDTLLTLGARYRFRSYLTGSEGTYVRVYGGLVSTMVYLQDTVLRDDGDASRIQLEGVTGGFGVGAFFKTQDETIWFVEWNLNAERHNRGEGLRVDADVPVVTSSLPVNDKQTIYSLCLVVGAFVF